MKEIAGAVGITDAALYKHFQSKREILETLYEERGFFRAMEVLEHLPGTRPAEEQFRLNALASADLWAENAGFLRIVLMESLAGDEMASEVHLGLMHRWRRGVERLVGIYAARGELDPGTATAIAGMIVDFLFGAFMDRLLTARPGEGGLPFSDPGFRSSISEGVAMLIRACRAPGAAPAPDRGG